MDGSKEKKDPYYRKWVRMNDEQVRRAAALQVTDPLNPHYGGIINEATGVPSPTHGGTGSHLASAAAALLNPDSAYYRDRELLRRFHGMADYMLNRQHEDGTISLGSTNFHSPPDTGFVVTGMGQLYRLLERSNWPDIRPSADKIKRFLERSIPAMRTGGCHTPNHRWVMTSALGWLYGIFQEEALVRRAEEWLAEGLDCTADGEWTERSNGIYNTVSDIMLYHTAQLLNRPELLEPVRRNLRMMAYFVHPDGEVVTEYSGRQDLGQRADLSEYVLIYRLMAALDRDPLFAAMSDWAAATMTRLGPINNHIMLGHLLFPQTAIVDLERAELPQHYEIVINEHHPAADDLQKRHAVGHHDRIEHSDMHLAFGSPVARYRSGETSATVMTRAPAVFSLRRGQAGLLGLQLYTSFTPGLVEMQRLERTEDGYRMASQMEKGYYGPIPPEHLPAEVKAGAAVSPWYLLPHQHRPVTHLQKHELQVDMQRIHDAEWRIRIRGEDMPDVYTQAALSFAAGCRLRGEGLNEFGHGAYFWKDGMLRLETDGGDGMEIEGSAHEHILREIRVNPLKSGVQTVLVNWLTPFDHTFTIRLTGGASQ